MSLSNCSSVIALSRAIRESFAMSVGAELTDSASFSLSGGVVSVGSGEESTLFALALLLKVRIFLLNKVIDSTSFDFNLLKHPSQMAVR